MVSLSIYGLIAFGVVATAIFLLFVYPARRRRRLVQSPLPDLWQAWIADAVPHYQRYPADLRLGLEQRLKIFIAEKSFYGCDGLEIEDRHRVTIAAQACLILLNRPVDDFAAVQAILLYPSAFRVPAGQTAIDEDGWDGWDGWIAPPDDVRLGESWEQGRVVLSWADIAAGIDRRRAGEVVETNVVVHEFAHQLDQAKGISGALPEGRDEQARAQDPASVLARAYADLQQAVAQQGETLIDPYGASDPAEFLAVSAELYFENPAALRTAGPQLYGVLCGIFRIDLAARLQDD